MDSNEDSAEKDSGPELQINLPESVMTRIEELMGGTDEFDSADFDPVAYINRLFPTEQSLAGIEAAIAKCEYRLASARSDSRRLLQEQTQQREYGQEALLQAQRLYKELASQISDINSKAERSESVVRSITSEMKLLDRGKSNLTAAVAGLTHQRLLRDASKQLSVLAPNRDYQQLATTLPATMQVLEQLSGYNDIEPIRVMRDEIYSIRDELAKQILTDFKQTFTGGSNPLSHRSLAAACLVVDQLPPRVRKELVHWFTDMQLQEYSALFSPEQESASISQVDRRYSWLKRHLVAFEKSLATVFPLPWKISHRIAIQFCERTRNALSEQLSQHRSQLDVQTLVSAVTQTRNFENLLEKRFQDPDAEENNQSSTEKPENESNDLEDVQRYKWVNSISVCFEPHLSIYVNSVDTTLRTLMDQLIQGSKVDSSDSNENSSLSACGRLLSVYKQALLQCTKLSHGQALIELSRVFGKYLQEFAGSVLGGAAGKAALNVPTLLSTLLKDDSTSHRFIVLAHNVRYDKGTCLFKDYKFKEFILCFKLATYTRQEINRLTDAITTAEYCLESTIHLEKKLKEKVAPANAKRIDFSLEQDLFHKTIHNCIQLLVQDLELTCEPALQTMTKISWLNFDTVGDQSSYITQLTMYLKNYIPTLRDNLNNSRKYFTQFCVRFANSFIPKFISNLFKCKPISTVGSEQLLLDTHMLKTVLLELPSLGLEEKRLAPATYTKVVIKLMSKAEMILKLVMAPVDLLNMESFVQQFVQLLPESSLNEFHKVFDMKGVKLTKSQLTAIDGMYKNISAKVSSGLK